MAAPTQSSASVVRAEVLLDETKSRINPNLYGHFIEHLGTCVNDGIWVGQDSQIRNINGIRADLVEALKAVSAPVIRWPGGCFADDYHWRDGVGPKKERKRRPNMHWGGIEDNQFGTHEYIEFCRLVGAEPYLAANLGSAPPSEMRDWMEYCNYPEGTTLSDQRKANGAKEPFGVKYWGIGNENWGCGGNMHPEEYAAEYRRYSTYMMNNWSVEPFLIACGPRSNDLDWTERFFDKYKGCACKSGPEVLRMHGYAAHHYSWAKGRAEEFTEDEYYELLADAHDVEQLILEQRDLMDRYDPERKIQLIVDEWGAWHKPTPDCSRLWQQNTVRDALLAAITLDTFNRHADKVGMANIAQTVNVLQSLLLTEGDKFVKTPTYFVYELYKSHMGGKAVRLEIESESQGRLPYVNGSASVRDGVVTVSLTNVHLSDCFEIELGGLGSRAESYRVLSYPAGDVRACNTFDAPEMISIAECAPPKVVDGRARLELKPASVSVLQVR